MTGREADERVAREMGERGWTAREIASALRMPRWWAAQFAAKKPRPPHVPSIEKPEVRAALADICAGMKRQDAHDKHGGPVFEVAFRLWMQGERL